MRARKFFRAAESWIRRKLRMHEHQRKVFCVGEIAFVKCTTCGAESFPWLVPKQIAKAWQDVHPEALSELVAIEKAVSGGVR